MNPPFNTPEFTIHADKITSFHYEEDAEESGDPVLEGDAPEILNASTLLIVLVNDAEISFTGDGATSTCAELRKVAPHLEVK